MIKIKHTQQIHTFYNLLYLSIIMIIIVEDKEAINDDDRSPIKLSLL